MLQSACKTCHDMKSRAEKNELQKIHFFSIIVGIYYNCTKVIKLLKDFKKLCNCWSTVNQGAFILVPTSPSSGHTKAKHTKRAVGLFTQVTIYLSLNPEDALYCKVKKNLQ